MFEPVSVFVHLETDNPSRVLLFQPIKLVQNSHKISTQRLHRLASGPTGVIEEIGDLPKAEGVIWKASCQKGADLSASQGLD
jgi:hypothetical protein